MQVIQCQRDIGYGPGRQHGVLERQA
jgi:hypothetical protein